ncbi:hypothetical protein DL769_001461 [Monosporascus sp. CRB-8-3]|nr:hypothetical protein DL769_001461 [Monosporascus sp. CRB-8-3]
MPDSTPSPNHEKGEPLAESHDMRLSTCPSRSWTPEEEKAVVKKIDSIVLPMLMGIYFMFQLDRANIFLEAGFMPAGLYTLSQWYKNSELSRRFAAFFAGYLLGQAVNGLLAYGILHMRGIGGLGGWQWLFLVRVRGLTPWHEKHSYDNQIEGIWTVLMGVVFGCLFPASLSRPVPFIGLRYFTDREAFILQQRIVQEDSHKHAVSQNIRFKVVFKTLANKKLWLHALMTLCGAIPSSSLAIYGPSIINSFGYDALASNALFSVADWISLCLVLGVGYVARGIITLIGTMIMLAFAALPTMGINVALIAGAQIFRSDDLPLYYRGRTIIVGVISLAVAGACALLVLYMLSNRRISKKLEYGDPHDRQGEVTGLEPTVVELAPRAHREVYSI